MAQTRIYRYTSETRRRANEAELAVNPSRYYGEPTYGRSGNVKAASVREAIEVAARELGVELNFKPIAINPNYGEGYAQTDPPERLVCIEVYRLTWKGR